MQMPNLTLVISSLKDSIKDFVAGHESGDPEELEELDFAHLQDGPRVNEDSDDEGARGVASASEEEVLAFASYLGIDAESHKDLLWVAQEALTSPLPFGWRECVGEGGAVFYVQKDTNAVQWEHPLDAYYTSLARKLVQEKESAVKRLVSIAEDTLIASAPYFAGVNQRNREVLSSIPHPTVMPDATGAYTCNTQATSSKSLLADADTTAAAAALVASQVAEDSAASNVSTLESLASDIDLRSAVYHHRSLASAAAYAADKVGDPKRDRRRKVLQFVQFLGMNPHEDQHLFWIAEEAANSPLPPHWEQLENEFGEEYFYNRRTNQCRTTHPLEDHYKLLYHKHKFPEAVPAAATNEQPSEKMPFLAKADVLLPPALRAALNYTNVAPQHHESLEQESSTSPAKGMMSLAAASRDGVAVYWGGYAVCGCIKSVIVAGPGSVTRGANAPELSLFPPAIAYADAASSHMRISVNVCSSSSRGLCHWISSVWWRLRPLVVANGHCMAIQDVTVKWPILQDAPAARGVLLALAKLCGPTNWPRRHLLALDICLSAGGGDTGACNALINEFLDVNGPLDRSDQDIHLKAKLKLQLQRNSIDIHIAQFAGYASSAAAPVFAALVGATATPNTPQSASFDSNAINQVLQYRSDFLAVPFVIAAQVGKRVEESIDQDILGQCSGWEFELEQMRLQAEEASRQRAEADAIAARAEAERAVIAKQNVEIATTQRWKAAQRAAFAFASLDAALTRQRAAAAAKLEAEAFQRSSEETSAAEIAAAEAAAIAERLRTEQERAVARELRLGRARMMERRCNIKLLLRIQDYWLNFVASAQQLRKIATAADSKNADLNSNAEAADSENLQYDSDGSHNVQSQLADEIVQSANSLNIEEQSVFKRLFTSRIQELDEDEGDSIDLVAAELKCHPVDELLPPEDTVSVIILPQPEPEFNTLDNVTGSGISPPPKSPALPLTVLSASAEDIHGSQQLSMHTSATASFSIISASGLVSQSHQSHSSGIGVGGHGSNAPVCPQTIDSPSSAHPAVLLPEEPPRYSDTHSSSRGQQRAGPKTPEMPLPILPDGYAVVASVDASTTSTDGLFGSTKSDTESSTVIARNRMGPKTPQTPLHNLPDGDAVLASVAAFAISSNGLFGFTASDAESSAAVARNRIGPKTPQTPLFSVRDVATANVAAGNEISAIPVSNGMASIAAQSPVFFRIGPRTPISPAGPTRHVRQWLVQDAKAVGSQLQMHDTNSLVKPHEPLFIRRSTKAPTVFEKIHALPSSVMSPFNELLSKTSPSSLQQNYIFSSIIHEPSLIEDDAAAHLPLNDATGIAKNKLFHPSDKSAPGPEPSTSPQRHIHGNRNTQTLPVLANMPGKHADKADVLSVHRATLLREMDAALRRQWPQSFKNTVQDERGYIVAQYDALRADKEGNVVAFMNLFYKHRSITVAQYGLVRDSGNWGISVGAPPVLKFSFKPPWVKTRN